MSSMPLVDCSLCEKPIEEFLMGDGRSSGLPGFFHFPCLDTALRIKNELAWESIKAKFQRDRSALPKQP